jgi:hypothetical protein
MHCIQELSQLRQASLHNINTNQILMLLSQLFHPLVRQAVWFFTLSCKALSCHSHGNKWFLNQLQNRIKQEDSELQNHKLMSKMGPFDIEKGIACSSSLPRITS